MKKMKNLPVSQWLAVAFLLFSGCADDEDGSRPAGEPLPTAVDVLHAGRDYVDLGLPSGTLWATADVTMPHEGADCPFFSWAETVPKSSYGVLTYKYGEGADSTLTKYCADAAMAAGGRCDSLLQLEPVDDVAQQQWKGAWFVPTWTQWKELHAACDWTTEKRAGKNCFVGKSKYNGKTITFGAEGARQGNKLLYAGNGAYYWSSTLMPDNRYAYGLSFSPDKINEKAGFRYMGHCVRAVIPGTLADGMAVDLGLPSGLRWAKANIGAASPAMAGLRYAWGETIAKSTFDFTNYLHCQGTHTSLTKYCLGSQYGTPDGKGQLEAADDAAIQAWGRGWRMPTAGEVEELLRCCRWQVVTLDGRQGYEAEGPSGRRLFFPFAGTIWGGQEEFAGQRGFYWTSTLDADGDLWAEGLFVHPQQVTMGEKLTRASGRSVRPVWR